MMLMYLFRKPMTALECSATTMRRWANGMTSFAVTTPVTFAKAQSHPATLSLLQKSAACKGLTPLPLSGQSATGSLTDSCRGQRLRLTVSKRGLTWSPF